ncbi:hypothetical protein NS226_03890 [Aureimonas ureilytica]|uniref:Glycosyltransferase family 1 protein n=1 Tax=Aureimonas ureilytica TaxID=401562 RepID=A0A175RBQ5_9HYPH|nr:hypothetical protein [Aureimonas ureilytica]KTQ97789.1 hypothetical protein NS226_03890 [Aureimonas ureilytica]
MTRCAYGKIAVLAPSNVQTGGPELLHQLVHEIRRQGGDAYIHYVPDPEAPVPERYRIYDTPPMKKLTLGKNDCLVAPETMVRQIPLLSKAERFIWWLSFDFFLSQRSGPQRLAANTYKRSLVKAQSLSGTKHLFQSHYARARLERWGVTGGILSDYLSVAPAKADAPPREDIILYNPKKGLPITERLQRAHPGLTFKPIINMTKAEVEDAFARAKIYIDFGEHPGKDRLPREAASLGTVVIAGQRGSAAFAEDMPLEDRYKLAIDPSLEAKFGALVAQVFGDFETHLKAQQPYRDFIAGERDMFSEQVRAAFFR